MSNPIPPSANPRFGAEHIARMLDQDPVMAGMVKEFIKPERLAEVLELPLPHFIAFIEAFSRHDEKEIEEMIYQWRADHPDSMPL